MSTGITMQLAEMNNQIKNTNRHITELNKNLETLIHEIHHMTIDNSIRLSSIADELNDMRRHKGDEGL